jgi:hypothetical protein
MLQYSKEDSADIMSFQSRLALIRFCFSGVLRKFVNNQSVTDLSFIDDFVCEIYKQVENRSADSNIEELDYKE